MGGKRIGCDVSKLTNVINQLESTKAFKNLFELQQAVSDSEYGRSIGISTANVYNYIKKFNIAIKTKSGERGSGLSKVHTKDVVRISRGDKWKEDPEAQKWIKGVKDHIKFLCNGRQRYESLLSKLEKGSLKAAIAVKCIECAGGSALEVKNCEVVDCALYQLRPWKSGDNEFAEIEIDDIKE